MIKHGSENGLDRTHALQVFPAISLNEIRILLSPTGQQQDSRQRGFASRLALAFSVSCADTRAPQKQVVKAQYSVIFGMCTPIENEP